MSARVGRVGFLNAMELMLACWATKEKFVNFASWSFMFCWRSEGGRHAPGRPAFCNGSLKETLVRHSGRTKEPSTEETSETTLSYSQNSIGAQASPKI